jgi:hypothetical protein
MYFFDKEITNRSGGQTDNPSTPAEVDLHYVPFSKLQPKSGSLSLKCA